ncbi:response regulator [Metabacillus sp. GX 13764]|uniref:response regulator n=1 Tax=Metabacillus kandeliae TaxID=2900151 RepID=UPI001E5F45B4|nr:response regulator [Metabacillus kandeliae]MCD7036000.1 response regulator [Metabacillus kandeliae]
MIAEELCRVLIVDDEQLIRRGMIHYLDWEREGFTVAGEASNGQEALQLIEQVRPHIIITDIVMPVMDGEELTRLVKERYPEIEVIVLSSFGEFDYVRSTFQNGAVDYILKPKLDAQSLLKGLRTASRRIPSFHSSAGRVQQNRSFGQLLQRMIEGYETAEPGKLPFSLDTFCLLGVDFAPDEIKKKLEPIFQELKTEGYSFIADQKWLIYLINTDDFQAVYDKISRFAAAEPSCRFILSEPFHDVSKLRQVYLENVPKLQNAHFYFPGHAVLTKAHLPEAKQAVEQFNLEWFTEELKRSRFEDAFQYLKNHAGKLSGAYWIDLADFKAFYTNIIFTITILLGNMKYNTAELESSRYVYLKEIEEAETAQKTINLLSAFLEEAKHSLEGIHPENRQIKKVAAYIKEHYAEPLTLTDIAKQFHFHPSYLSSSFSSHMQEGMIEYLNKVRIEKAAELLIEDEKTISEISEAVGFSDHSYFCKVFKKVKGLPPSKYKRQHAIR